jgi:hypothetical protein
VGPDGIPAPPPELMASLADPPAAWPPPPARDESPTTPSLPEGLAGPPTTPDLAEPPIDSLPRSSFVVAIQRAREAFIAGWRALVEEARTKLPPAWNALRAALHRLPPLAREAWAKLVPLARRLMQEPRPKWLLPVVGGAGLLVGIGLVATIVSLARGGGSDARAALSGAAPSASEAVAGTATSAAPPPAEAPGPAVAACAVAGSPHVIAPSALLTAGVEVVRLGDDIGVGFAPSDRDAMAVRLDPVSLAATATASVAVRGGPSARRVTPYLARGSLSIAVDVDKKGDALQGRRTVYEDTPLQIGVADGSLAVAPVGRAAPAAKLWALPPQDEAAVDALRGAFEPGHDGAETVLALAFRRGSSEWIGIARGDKTPAPSGELSRVDGLGPAVGSPAVAISDGAVMVAWADRPTSDDPWRLRWVRFRAGDAPGAPATFTPPAGGRGEQTMSPGLAGLPGGRFLLVWTEGPTSAHDVRALTLANDGSPLGPPLVISNEGVNAGQGQAAMTAAGKGVVAFLESGAGGFEVAATAIVCP